MKRRVHRPEDAAAPLLQKGSSPPSVSILMNFVRFHAAIGKSRIDGDGLITVESSNTFIEWFFAGFERVTGSQVAEDDRRMVYYINI